MANHQEAWSDNVGGSTVVDGQAVSFYVDMECILCSVCSDHAPSNFRISEDEDHDICFRQPANSKELADCRSAVANCPVEAIGEDGA